MPTLKFIFSIMKILDMLSFIRYERIAIHMFSFILHFDTIRLPLINSIANIASKLLCFVKDLIFLKILLLLK